ncbi:MAG: TolC family protein [Acidobacteriota bacterium]
MRWSCVVVAVASLGVRAQADPPKPMSLEDVLAVAVRTAPELERAALDVEVARGNLQRAEGIEDFRVTASGSFLRFSVPGDSEDVSTGTIDVGRNLPTGGSLHVTGSATKVGMGAVFNGIPYPSGVTSALQVSLVQPLLRGFGLAVARAPRHEAEARRDAAALDRELRARELVRSIVEAYWRVALAHAELEIRKASLATAESQRAFTEASIKIGKFPRSELLAVEQVIAVRKQDVLAAELDVTDRSLALRRIAGMEIGADAIEVETAPLPQVKPVELDLRDLVAKALAHNPTIVAAEATETAEAARAAAAHDTLLPQLDLGASAGPLGLGPTLSSSLGSLQKADGYQVGVSVTSSYAIGRNDEHGQDRAARARLYKAKVDLRDARAAVAADTARTVQLTRAAGLSIELGDKAVELAAQNVEAEQHRFEDRKSTNFDVLLRQTELQQAKLRRALAVVDYLAARAKLDALTGVILENYGIRLTE